MAGTARPPWNYRRREGEPDRAQGVLQPVVRAVGAEGALGDDFAPAAGAGADLLQHLRGEWAVRQGLSCLVLAESVGSEVLMPLYNLALSFAKWLLASPHPAGLARRRAPRYTPPIHPCFDRVLAVIQPQR